MHEREAHLRQGERAVIRRTFLLPEMAEQVQRIVSETFGGDWDGFQRYITEPSQFGHEWRFRGELGFGGKLHYSASRLYVSCYPEAETPVLRAAIAHINSELKKLVGQVEFADA